ncbi:hypothetical protein [Streptomyces sp. NBC_00120]|uniref:hypothetical protein n=1 Tax=Streptomyces sp. NBC_00120 TaxID=2975660 RepID=UPI002253E7A4|nr:hypothetical protein [Streptomyces sp. NBC_00120]
MITPEERDPAGRVTLDLVLMSDPGWPTDVARRLQADLVGLLSSVRVDVDWRVSVNSSALALAAQADPPSMMRALTQRLHGRTWDLALFVTDLPFRANARPVVLMLSRPERVALVSLPSLGWFRVSRRARDAALYAVSELLAASAGPQEEVHRPGGAERYLVLPGRSGRLRLLAGMVRANRPWLLFTGLSRVLAVVFATASFGLLSSDVWNVSRHLGPGRACALTFLSITAVVAWLVIDHELWERPRGSLARYQARLYNLATVVTLYLGIAFLYAALFVLIALTALFLLPSGTLGPVLGHEPDAAYYLSLAWFITSMGTVGGALGAGLEDDQVVRQAAYGERQRLGQRQDTTWSDSGG